MLSALATEDSLLIQRREEEKTPKDEPHQARKTTNREERLAILRAASQKWRDNLTPEQRETLREQARVRGKKRREKLAMVSKPRACMSVMARLDYEERRALRRLTPGRNG